MQLRKMSGFCSSDGSGGGIGSLLFIQIMEMNEIFSLIQITEMNEILSLTQITRRINTLQLRDIHHNKQNLNPKQ